MNKRGILLVSSFILVSACDSPDEVSEIEVEETIVEDEDRERSIPEPADEAEAEAETHSDAADEEDEEINYPVSERSGDHVFMSLVDLGNFTNELGDEAWDDYQSIVDQVTISELSLEGVMNASSSGEVDAIFNTVSSKDNRVKDVIDVTEDEQMVIYRYPAHDSSDDIPEYVAELSFYYFEDQLIFSSITPGFYSVDLEGLPSTEDLSQLMTVSEIEALNSKVYTVAEMVVLGERLHQIMVPAMGVDEEGHEVVSAFYFFTREEDIIQFAYLPFELTSIDFPTYSILLYQEIISSLEGI